MESQHLIAEKYYKSAQNYYSAQRDNFLKQVTGIAKDTEISLWRTKFIQEFNAQAANLSGTPLENTEAFKKAIIQPIEQLAESTLGSAIFSPSATKQISVIKNSPGRTKQDAENFLNNYSNRIKDSFNKVLETDQQIKSSLANLYINIFGTKTMANTSMSGMISLFRKSMISQVVTGVKMTDKLLSDSNIRGYIQLFKGYNAEIITEQAGNILLSQLSSKWRASQIGSSGGITDIGIGPIKNIEEILQKIEDETLNISIEALSLDPLQAYGIQAKSWFMPNDVLSPDFKGNLRQFYSIGDRATLYSALGLGVRGKNSWWHTNIVGVARNLVQTLGAANILFVTGGNKYIWTVDLIRQFRENQYLLSFYYRREKGKFYYPPTKEVTWQQEVTGYGRGKYGSKD